MGGTFEMNIPKDFLFVFANGTIRTPKAGKYIYEVDKDNNMVYFKLKEKE